MPLNPHDGGRVGVTSRSTPTMTLYVRGGGTAYRITPLLQRTLVLVDYSAATAVWASGTLTVVEQHFEGCGGDGERMTFSASLGGYSAQMRFLLSHLRSG